MQTQFSLSAEELSGMSKVHCLVLLGCFCILLLDFSSLIFFPEKVFWWEFFFPWLHSPCNLWCHWLSFCLAHPNKCFAIILYRELDMLFYGIILHAYIAPYCYAYCIGTSRYIFCQCPHVAWPKPMACQLFTCTLYLQREALEWLLRKYRERGRTWKWRSAIAASIPMNFMTVICQCVFSCVLVHDMRLCTHCALYVCTFVCVCVCVWSPSIVLAAHYRYLKSSCNWKVPLCLRHSSTPAATAFTQECYCWLIYLGE